MGVFRIALVGLVLVTGSARAGDITSSNVDNRTNGNPGCESCPCPAAGGQSGGAKGGSGGPAEPATADKPSCPPHSMGNPIDIFSGNKFHRETIYAGGGEMPLELELFYNSKHMTTPGSANDPQPRTIKGQWTHTFWGHLRVNLSANFPDESFGRKFVVRRADGQSVYFQEPGSATIGYLPSVEPGADVGFFRTFGPMTGQGGYAYSAYEYERPDGMVERYDGAGLLVEIRSRQGPKITISRSAPANGTITATIDRSMGGSMTLVYTEDPAGSSDDSCFHCPVSFTSPDAHVWTFIHVNPAGTGCCSQRIVDQIVFPADTPNGNGPVRNFRYQLEDGNQ